MKTQIENNVSQPLVIDSLQAAWDASDSQITIQELLNQRMYLKGAGWSNISITWEFRNFLAESIAESIGGREATKATVKSVLRRQHPPQHWGLARFVIEKYGDTNPRIAYIAGQDQTWENAAMRNYLKNL